MKLERRVVDPSRGIVQITTEDERWYSDESRYIPSVTWITSCYPKGVGYMKWLASKGWNEAEAIKAEAGDRGSRVHNAIDLLLSGESIAHDRAVAGSGEAPRELTADEYGAVMSFASWYDTAECERCEKQGCLRVVAHDYVVFGPNYAGTVDIKALRQCDGSFGIIDAKTSRFVWESHRAQVQAYRHADPETAGRKGWAAILQVGYPLNKAGYKFTVVPPSDWQLFVTSRRIWNEQHKDAKPLQRDFPLAVTLKERS